MRGKGLAAIQTDGSLRITPAYAGKRRSRHLSSALSWDHPRLCGEKLYEGGKNPCLVGSPPPMRGKVQRKARHDTPTRITPAYAGKSQLEIEPFAPPQDHPRLCGEKQAIPHKELQEVGSPPPMRGKGPLAYPNVQHHRITPAYAGKSHSG